MSFLGKGKFKIRRLNAAREEFDSRLFFCSEEKFNLNEAKTTDTEAKADRKTFTEVDNHASFEFNFPKSDLTAEAETILNKLNLTSVEMWPYADNNDFHFPAIVQVRTTRPYSGWRDIDFYNVKIYSKKEVVIDTTIIPPYGSYIVRMGVL